MPVIYYILNFIKTNTEGSYVSMYLFFHDHWFRVDNAIPNEVITEIKTRTFPFYVDFNAAYQDHTIASNNSKAATAAANDLFKLLGKDNINSYDLEVQKSFPKQSQQYKTIFANGHKPFYSGPYELRLEAFEAFYRIIIEYPELALLAATVIDFKDRINAKWEEHKRKLDRMKVTSEILESKRILSANEIYGNVAKLMFQYRDDPSKIEGFFDFNIIREKPSPHANVYIDFIQGGLTRNLVSRTFTDRSRVLLENSGDTDLCFGLVASAATPCIDTGLILHPDEKKSVWVSDLGDLNYTFLNVTNLYGAKDGHYSVSDFG